MAFTAQWQLILPSSFRISDILTFHQRDVTGLSEVVMGNTLRKGIVWQHIPLELFLQFEYQQVQVELLFNDQPEPSWEKHLFKCVQRMCGLTQPIDLFKQEWGGCEKLLPLYVSGTHLRFALTPTPFEALSWAVVSQQISVKAAVQLRHRLIQVCAIKTKTGLFCYPDALTLGQLSSSVLQELGFPRSKADTLKRLSDFALTYDLDELDGNHENEMHALGTQLLAIKGIGPWTVNYGLLRGYGYLDGSLHGDIALRRALQILWQHPDDVTEKQAEEWLQQFRPWRALVAAYLWQYTGA